MSLIGVYEKQNVKKSLKHFILGKSLSLIVGFGFFLIIARALEIEEFGLYIILVALLEIIGLSSNFGCYFIAQRYIPELMQKKNYQSLKKLLFFLLVFRITTLVSVLLLLFILLEPLLNYFSYSQYIWVFQVYLVVVFFENISRFVEMIFDSLLLQGYSQISILFRMSLRFIVVLALFLYSVEAHISLQSLIFIEVAIGMLAFFVVGALLMKFIYSLPKGVALNRVKLDYVRYFDYARPGYVAQIIGLTYSAHTVKFVMLKMFGAVETALFGFASMLVAMLARYMPSFLLVGMIRPLFITAYNEKDDYRKLHRLTHIIVKINLLCILPIIIFLFVLSDETVLLLAGDKFENGGMYLFLFSIFMCIQVFHVILSQLNMAHEGGGVLLKATFLSAFGVVLGLMLVGFFGSYAIVLGIILSEVIFCLVLSRSLSQSSILNMTSFKGGKSFFLASALSLITLSTAHLVFNGEGLGYLVLLFGLMIVVFLVSLYFIKPFTEDERRLINQVLPFPYFCF